jgi:hypothetical protein
LKKSLTKVAFDARHRRYFWMKAMSIRYLRLFGWHFFDKNSHCVSYRTEPALPGGGLKVLLSVAATLGSAVTGGAVGGILLVLRPCSEFAARSIWTDWRQYQSNYMNWSSAQS